MLTPPRPKRQRVSVSPNRSQQIGVIFGGALPADQVFECDEKHYDKFIFDRNAYMTRMESKTVDDIPETGFATRPCKIIATYNFKGGVGKTTTAVNLATTIARSGRRVLLVDGDPQCNLTAFCLPSPEDAQDDNGEPALAPGPPAAVAAAADLPLIKDDGYVTLLEDDVFNINLLNLGVFHNQGIEDVHGLFKKMPHAPKEVNPPKRYFKFSSTETGDNLLMIPGNPLIATEEDNLKMLPFHWSAIRLQLRAAATVTESDFVIVDLGPSAATLNQIFVLSCDCILPPVAPDYFSLSSMNCFLKSLLPDLMTTHSKMKESIKESLERIPDCKAYGYGFNPNFPRLLPFLATNYKTHKLKVTRRNAVFIDAMRRLVSSDGISNAVKHLYRPSKDRQMVICFMKNCDSLLKKAQEWGHPAVLYTKQSVQSVRESGNPEIQTPNQQERQDQTMMLASYQSLFAFIDALQLP